MSEPKVAFRGPAILTLEPGTYAWCACGESQNQPFCDGSHKAKGEFKPIIFKIEQTEEVALCRCKHSEDKPYCDGSHAGLPVE